MKLTQKILSITLCFCLVFVMGGAARAESGSIVDRNGAELTEENYPLYTAVCEAFSAELAQGISLRLSVDSELENAVRDIIGEAPGGCAVVIDIETGAPLALVSVGGLDSLNSLFMPGRLFTPCTALASFAEGLSDPEMKISCEGVFTRYAQDGIAPECWLWNAVEGQHLTHPKENIVTALRDSCDYYFYALGNDLGIDAISAYAQSLGLGEPSGIELAETVGTLRFRESKTDGEQWQIGDTLEAAVGYSESRFSALQLARYCAVLAKGSKIPASSILLETSRDAAVNYARRSETELALPIAQESFAAIREGMYCRVNDPINRGDAEHALSLAGLSGQSDDGTALFMCFAPYEAPEIAVFVALRNSALTPEQAAAEIAEQYFEE